MFTDLLSCRKDHDQKLLSLVLVASYFYRVGHKINNVPLADWSPSFRSGKDPIYIGSQIGSSPYSDDPVLLVVNDRRTKA